MNDIKVSIIVPVYNVEKFLEKCLESIINQTLKDIEIICVNDGSEDKSRKILAKYAKKDSRIVIIDQKNAGLSCARNAGMKIAQGEYIGFVDADDWIDETMYEKLYNNAVQNNSQMVIAAVHKYDDQTKEIVDDDPYFTLGYFNETFNNKVFSHYDTKSFLFEITVMAWNKVYKRSFLEEHNAKYPDGLIFEDGPFFHSIYYKMDKVTIVRDFLYYYRVNRKNSIIQKAGKNFIDIFEVVRLIWNSIVDLPYLDEIKYDFFEKRFKDINYRYSLMNRKYKKKYFHIFKSFDILYDENYFDFKYIEKKYYVIYVILTNIKKYEYFDYETNYRRICFKNSIKYKIMEILYLNPEFYTFKCYKFMHKIKKNTKYIDIWYCEDFIHAKIFRTKFKFRFEYSKLVKQND